MLLYQSHVLLIHVELFMLVDEDAIKIGHGITAGVHSSTIIQGSNVLWQWGKVTRIKLLYFRKVPIQQISLNAQTLQNAWLHAE